MKNLIAFILLLIVFSCSNREEVLEFEKILGIENSQALTLMVSNFENEFLKTEYPNLTSEQAYERLLTDMRDNKFQSWNKLPKFDETDLKQSQLKFEINAYVDSVWIETNENPRIVWQYNFLGNNGTFYKKDYWSSYNKNPSVNKDSIIEDRYTWFVINYPEGRYWKALSKTCQKDKFIMDYLNFSNSFGRIPFEIMASRMLSANLDYSDFFIKRIIVTRVSS
ncbi:hypothetical protein DFQ03_1008 [Maribacter caenipelagi]|uniref:Lipoprotein n=1 Tax=Maribacter caenipelagi TaxID=1447781 RepID=A0A4R7D7B5_9FLAO|nr:hypothetical protein [Maribacter caenipelagi]TDS16527.1 hypothetical protein DFQ03_1008 [Maribacter caenipelagi]